MLTDALLDRFYTDDVSSFVDAVVSNVPADVAATAAAEARRYHALRVAQAVTAAYQPYRLGVGKVGGGRFAKKGDVGIDILRDLLRGKGEARSTMHADFSKRYRADTEWGRGDLTPNNINRWSTESFGPRPTTGADGNAWDAGRRELSSFLTALPRRDRVPNKPGVDTTPGDGGLGEPDAATIARNRAEADAAMAKATATAHGKPAPKPAKVADAAIPKPPDTTPDDLGEPDAATIARNRAEADAAMGRATANVGTKAETAAPANIPATRNADGPATTPVGSRTEADAAMRSATVAADTGAPKSIAADFSDINAKVPDKVAKAVEGGQGTKESPFVTSDVNAAAFLLGHDQHVQLKSEDQVATLLNKLQERVKLLKDVGAETPNFDMCKITVPDTNLFCAESKGIPRIEMPQLGGKPIPGSPADGMEKNDRGEVDLSNAFIEHLKGLGIDVADRDVDASHLKASQIELNGTKIVGMMDALHEGKLPPGAIFVSRDNYVVDGHHRWAANVGAEYVDGQPMVMPTHTIDADIIDVLGLANEFALSQGIPQAGVGDMQTDGRANEMSEAAVPPGFPPDLVPNITGGDGTAKNPFKTADPTTAAHLLHSDQHVQLDAHPGQVTVVLDEVREMGKAIKAAGDKPPKFDLCKLTVPGTSLFCVESKGINRVRMPQFSGTPLPGSEAEGMVHDEEGRVNISSEFPGWLAERGITVTPGRRKVNEMKPTQNELDGFKTGKIMQGWRDVAAQGITRVDDRVDGDGNPQPQFATADGTLLDPEKSAQFAGLTDAIFVDRDGYIVDGHHRWSAAMGADVEMDGDIDFEMDTLEISDDVDIIEVIALANAFALEKGIPSAGVGQETGDTIPQTPDAPAVPDVTAPGAPGGGVPVVNELAGVPDAPTMPTHQQATPETKTFTTADEFPLGRFGIPAGTEIQARYKDDDNGIVTVTKSDGTVQDMKVPWARLNLPSTASDTAGASGIQFEATPASSAAISDADRTLAAAYNPRSQTLADLSSTNLLTRLAIADAMERNPPDSGTAQFLRRVQAESQAALKAQGITHVTLYRGIAGTPDSPFPPDTTGLSSWTTNPDIAAGYAKGTDGTLFKATVPVDQILSWDVLGALRSPNADQPGSEILVARDASTAQRIGTGTFPYVANAPSAMAGTQAGFDPWDVFHPKADAVSGANVRGASGDVPAAAVPDVTPDAPVVNELFGGPSAGPRAGFSDAVAQADMAADDAKYRATLDTMAQAAGIDGAGLSNGELAGRLTAAKGRPAKPGKGLGGFIGRMLRVYPDAGGGVPKPREQQTATDLLGSDTSPDHIREVLKSGDLTDAQRAELRKLLPVDPVTAALAVAEESVVRRRMSAVDEARAIAARFVNERVG